MDFLESLGIFLKADIPELITPSNVYQRPLGVDQIDQGHQSVQREPPEHVRETAQKFTDSPPIGGKAGAQAEQTDNNAQTTSGKPRDIPQTHDKSEWMSLEFKAAVRRGCKPFNQTISSSQFLFVVDNKHNVRVIIGGNWVNIATGQDQLLVGYYL